jgi:hypothetical protein
MNEETVAYIKLLSWHLAGETEVKDEKISIRIEGVLAHIEVIGVNR